MSFVKVAAISDLWDGEMKPCIVAGRKVLLVRIEGEVYAYDDRCAHLGVPLSEGRLDQGVLTCSAHHYQYDARSGHGLNPKSVHLLSHSVRTEQGHILVEVSAKTREKPSAASDSAPEPVECAPQTKPDRVGPVLEIGETAQAIIAAIRELNADVTIVDKGAYARVLVPTKCIVTRESIERLLGRPFCLPGDLEIVMPSFKGALAVTEGQAVWSTGARR